MECRLEQWTGGNSPHTSERKSSVTQGGCAKIGHQRENYMVLEEWGKSARRRLRQLIKKTAHPKGCAVFVSSGKDYFPSLSLL